MFIRAVLFVACISTLMISSHSYAATGAMQEGQGSAQNAIGDVVGPSRGGGLLGGSSDGSALTRLDSVDIFTDGGMGGILADRLDLSNAALSALTSLFDDLPPGLQYLLLDALYSSDGDIEDLILRFLVLQELYDNVDNITCGEGVSLAEYHAYAQNKLLANISVSDILAGGSFNPSAGLLAGMSDVCGDAGAPQISTPGEESAPEETNTPDIADRPEGELVSTESNCSSSWSSLPPAMRGNDQELHSQIRRGAAELGMDPSTFAGIIWLESGGDPRIFNPCSNCSATGLIQFTRTTAGELGYPSASKEEHRANIQSLSVAQQVDLAVKYFKQRKWKPGMSDYQAYATVHHGNPFGSSADGATGTQTIDIFNRNVLPKIERYRCGGYDWNELQFAMS